MAATGMPLINAIGSSLVSVTAFGVTTAASYALSGLVDWRLAGLFVLGGAIGGLIGIALGQMARDLQARAVADLLRHRHRGRTLRGRHARCAERRVYGNSATCSSPSVSG